MFATYYDCCGARVRRLAHRLSRGDPDLAADLEQEALVALWRASTHHVHTNEAAVLMRIARDAMLKWRRREDAAQVITAWWILRSVRRKASAAARRRGPRLHPSVPRHLGAAPECDTRAA